jgi:hypothetical protein
VAASSSSAGGLAMIAIWQVHSAKVSKQRLFTGLPENILATKHSSYVSRNVIVPSREGISKEGYEKGNNGHDQDSIKHGATTK